MRRGYRGPQTSEALTIAVPERDQTGQELLEQALRVLDADVCALDIDLCRFDLSLESRRETANAVVTQAAQATCEFRYGLKAATITPEGAQDVGAPNRASCVRRSPAR